MSTFEQDAVSQFNTAADTTDEVEAEKVSNDPQLSNLWGLTKIDAAEAWNVSTGSQSVVVAVIDTGVDYTDPDLAANIWTNPNAGKDGFQGDVHGYNFVDNDGNPMDDNGHGTHVAGILGAVGNNGQGVVGVNWSVSIMPLKFLNSDGTGYLSDAIRAINYVTMERTQYRRERPGDQCQLGRRRIRAQPCTAPSRPPIDAGILFVTAAGNNGTNNDTTAQYPANYTAAERDLRGGQRPERQAGQFQQLRGHDRSIWPPPACRSIARCPATSLPRTRARAWPRPM